MDAKRGQGNIDHIFSFLSARTLLAVYHIWILLCSHRLPCAVLSLLLCRLVVLFPLVTTHVMPRSMHSLSLATSKHISHLIQIGQRKGIMLRRLPWAGERCPLLVPEDGKYTSFFLNIALISIYPTYTLIFPTLLPCLAYCMAWCRNHLSLIVQERPVGLQSGDPKFTHSTRSMQPARRCMRLQQVNTTHW